MPLGSNVIVTIFPPEKRGVAMGTMGIAMILAPTIGPTLSGYIVQNYHWNVMFYGMFFLGIRNDIWLFLVQIVSRTTNPEPTIKVSSTVRLDLVHYYTDSVKPVIKVSSGEIVTMFIIGAIFIVHSSFVN